MEKKLQTKVTDENREKFFVGVYPQSTKTKAELIPLDRYNVSAFVLVDCCGWHYKSLWPDLNIMGLERLHAIKEYNWSRSKFQGIIDDRNYLDPKWPTLEVKDSALIFDNSVIMKYRPVSNLIELIQSASLKYDANTIIFKSQTRFIDDTRLGDRISTLSTLLIPGYVVTSFIYDTANLEICYRKKLNL